MVLHAYRSYIRCIFYYPLYCFQNKVHSDPYRERRNASHWHWGSYDLPNRQIDAHTVHGFQILFISIENRKSSCQRAAAS